MTMKRKRVTQLRQQQHKKRDVKEIIKLRDGSGSDEPIYGNNVPGDQAELVFSVFQVAPNDNYYFA